MEEQDSCPKTRAAAPVQIDLQAQHRQQALPTPPISEGPSPYTTLARVLFQRLTLGLWHTTRPPIYQFDQTRESFLLTMEHGLLRSMAMSEDS